MSITIEDAVCKSADIDLDLLAKQVKEILNSHLISYSHKAIQAILDKWLEVKTPLLDKLKEHPNYDFENLAIYIHKFRAQAHVNKLINNWARFREDISKHNESLKEAANVIDGSIKRSIATLSPFSLLSNEYRLLNSVGLTHEKPATCNAKLTSTLIWLSECKEAHNCIFSRMPAYREVVEIIRLFNRKASSYVVSVHPCDYLLMSNGNSWKSCHRLGGAYTSGTMSYMLDGITLIAYTIPNGRQSSYYKVPKISRTVVFMDDDCATIPKIYPENTSEIADIYEELIGGLFGYTVTPAYPKYLKTVANSTHYSDYTHYIMSQRCKKLNTAPFETATYVGSPPICVTCGRLHDTFESLECGSNHRCRKHRDVSYCDHCSAVLNDHDFSDEQERLCDTCGQPCDMCGKRRYHEGAVLFEVLQEDGTCIDKMSLCTACIDKTMYSHCDYCHNNKPSGELVRLTYTKKPYGSKTKVGCMSCLDGVYDDIDYFNRQGKYTIELKHFD